MQLYIPNLCIEHPVERFGEVNGIEDIEDSDAQDDANEVNACLQQPIKIVYEMVAALRNAKRICDLY